MGWVAQFGPFGMSGNTSELLQRVVSVQPDPLGHARPKEIAYGIVYVLRFSILLYPKMQVVEFKYSTWKSTHQ